MPSACWLICLGDVDRGIQLHAIPHRNHICDIDGNGAAVFRDEDDMDDVHDGGWKVLCTENERLQLAYGRTW